MKRVVLAVLVCVGLFLAGFAGWMMARVASFEPTPGIAEGLRELRYARLDGEWWGVRDDLGRVVVLDFWATWCGPCRAQARVIELVRAEFATAEVSFMGVNLGEDAAVVSRALEDDPAPYEVVLDPQQTTSERTGIVDLPTLVILDRSGALSWIRVGLTGKQELAAAIRQALDTVVGDGERLSDQDATGEGGGVERTATALP